jgi:hypothetical protein
MLIAPAIKERAWDEKQDSALLSVLPETPPETPFV